MTFPLPQNEPPQRRRANWLGRYLDVEGKFDDRLKDVLSQATTDVSDAFGDLRDDLFSAKVRRAQLVQSRRSIRRIINNVFGTEHDLIREHQQDAAMAATDAQLYESRGILARIFDKPADLQSFSRAAEATAARNIDAVMTRVFETEKPLSARVYNSQAIAQGWVNREINKALATGGSARDLAKSVTALIDPDVPGGVSYAARRLGTTELNNAFHAQSIHDAQAIPWVESMEWHLSKIHESDPGDECEEYAERGLFPTDSVPEKPHPHCRCYVTPEQPPREEWEAAVDSGQYDSYLDDWLENDGETLTPPPLPRTPDAYAVTSDGQESTRPVTPKPIIKATAKSKVPEEVKLQPISEIENSSHALAELKRRHDVKVVGLEYVPEEFRPQLYRGIDEMKIRFPKVKLKTVSLEDLPREGAMMKTEMGDPNNLSIRIHRPWINDPAFAKRRAAEDMSTGYSTPGTMDDPVFGTFVHEYGHALHATVGGTKKIHLLSSDRQDDPGFYLHQAWQADSSDTSGTLEDYMDKNLSGYSYKAFTPATKGSKAIRFNFNDAEAIPEGFAAAVILGDKANSAQKALLQLLTDHLEEL